jgi:hypothetical protein
MIVDTRCGNIRTPKAANRFAKKDPLSGGVSLLLSEQAQHAALANMELTDLWGVARRLAERLRAIGITTPLELRDADPRLIRERFTVVQERTVLELRGIACLDLEEIAPDRKSLIASRSFEPADRTPAGIGGSGIGLYGARGREDAPAEPRHGQYRDLDRNQQLQADRPSICGVEIRPVARRDGRHRKTDRGGNRGPRYHLQARLREGLRPRLPRSRETSWLIGRIEPSALSRLHRDFEQGVLEKKIMRLVAEWFYQPFGGSTLSPTFQPWADQSP